MDALLNDFALKYTASCRDHRNKAIGDAEYACKRDNMDQALETIRAMSQTLQEVKNVADAQAQKDVILKNIEIIQQRAASNFNGGCGSALSVDPPSVSFPGPTFERTIQIQNVGNRDTQYHVIGLPEAFLSVYGQGDATPQRPVVVSIKRAPFKVEPNKDIVFYVSDDSQKIGCRST